MGFVGLQERSDGLMQLGPSDKHDIKNKIESNYDTLFVASEVDAASVSHKTKPM